LSMRKRREALTPDITPLVDIVFLLLIFFLVSTVFKKEELALLLNLPAAGEAAQKVERKEISIELSEETVALRGEKIDFATLDARLAEVKEKERPVIVRIDKNVRYERVVKLFDLLKKHGLNNLALVNEPKP